MRFFGCNWRNLQKIEIAVSPFIDGLKFTVIQLEEIEGKYQFRVFSPLLYQLSYPANELNKALRSRKKYPKPSKPGKP
jgi:hypothetical protein